MTTLRWIDVVANLQIRISTLTSANSGSPPPLPSLLKSRRRFRCQRICRRFTSPTRISSEHIHPANAANRPSRIGVTPQQETALRTDHNHLRLASRTNLRGPLRMSLVANHMKIAINVGTQRKRRYIVGHKPPQRKPNCSQLSLLRLYRLG